LEAGLILRLRDGLLALLLGLLLYLFGRGQINSVLTPARLKFFRLGLGLRL
jgi:hypothetical protein